MIDFQQLGRELDAEMGMIADPQAEAAYNGEGGSGEEESAFNESDSHLIQVTPLPPIVDSTEFVAKSYTPSPELVNGMIHQGTKVVIGGGSKSFKTWCQLDLAICVAYGLSWMGHDCTPGRVLFVNLEIKEEFFQARIRKICEARGIQQIPERLDIWNLRGYSAPYRIIIPKIIERIKDTGYSLIDLDPIYKLYGNTDENSASEVGQLMNELESVTVKTNSTVAFGAHYSKGNQAAKESIDRISGSGVFARDPDSIIPFTKHEEENSFVVEPILRNLPPITPFVVTWNYPLMELDATLDPSKLKQSGGRPKVHSSNDIFDLLDPSGMTNSDWQNMAEKQLGISRRTFYRLKEDLKASGVIIFSRINEHWKPVQKP